MKSFLPVNTSFEITWILTQAMIQLHSTVAEIAPRVLSSLQRRDASPQQGSWAAEQLCKVRQTELGCGL